MKSNQEILDKFGKVIIENVFDDNYRYIKQIFSGNTKWNVGKEYTDIFNKLNIEDKKKLKTFFYEMLKTNIFSFLSIFENNENYKIYFEDDKKKINIDELSEMLKAEPVIENGWIDRFSKELKKEE